jgi:hypothetical protein
MNIHNDSSDDSTPRDPLAERLHREALAERQPFSPELHSRILERIREVKPAINSPSVFSRTRWLAIAGAILASIAIGLSLLAHSHRAPAPIAQIVPPAPSAPVITPLPTSGTISLALGAQLSANLWPPQISITLPSTGEPSARTAEQPDSTIPDPAESAQAALSDVVPPNILDFAYALRDASRLLQ